jgi:hypothetical protein
MSMMKHFLTRLIFRYNRDSPHASSLLFYIGLFFECDEYLEVKLYSLQSNSL